MMHSLIERFGYWPLDKRRRLGSHRNSGLEIVLVMRGHLTWHVEGQVETVSPGSVFFTLPWETHGSVHEREAGCELSFAVVKLDRPYRRFSKSFGFAKSLGMDQSALRILRESLLGAPKRSWPATGRLAKLFPELIEELSRPIASTDAIAALVRLLLIELQRSIAGQALAPTPAPSLHRVHSFVDRLVNECHRPWTLSSMAGACNLGRSRFTALLEQVTGDTPMMALNRARVDRAQALLRATDWPVTRIAMDCGFGSSQYFAGVFKAYAGTTARRYRARLAKNSSGQS
jgi:AraC-like DNA-binding protein